MRYEHTQIGHVIIWSLLVGAVVFAADANFGSSVYRTTLLLGCIVLLFTVALFYKLTVRISNESLCASFGIGIIRKRVPTAEIAACQPIRIRWWYGWGFISRRTAGSTTSRGWTLWRSGCVMVANLPWARTILTD
jgi:hypothetical protein